ncbi:MAG: hypothetical protein ACRDPY_33300 [Streptosporangiaceae bacterium]
MSILVWLVAAGTGILTGGASGYLASVYSAGPVARRQASANRRIAAEQTITNVVTDYLGRIRAFELNPQFIYPKDYAAISGRERLAEDVLAQLPALKRDTSRGIRGHMAELVGSKTMDVIRLRLGVPADARPDETKQAGQYEVIERLIRLGYHRGVGCKQELYPFCEVEHLPEVRNDYGVLGLLWLVQGHPLSHMRPKVQEEAIALLQAILDQVQPDRIKAAKQDEIEASVHATLNSSRLVRRLRAAPGRNPQSG